MKLSEFDFDLPKNLIAKYPKYPRGSSKLLYLNGNSKILSSISFYPDMWIC
jgi:S-adenosylmethionine:tRNA-ribosyltransferase-isomerase (queuine synthetase)